MQKRSIEGLNDNELIFKYNANDGYRVTRDGFVPNNISFERNTANFNGSTSWLDTNSEEDLQDNNYTIKIICKPTGVYTGIDNGSIIIAAYDSSDTTSSWNIAYNTSNILNYSARIDASTVDTMGAVPIAINEEGIVHYVIGDTNIYSYKNGILVDTQLLQTPQANVVRRKIIIGRNYRQAIADYTRYWFGDISLIEIRNRQYSADEVKNDVNGSYYKNPNLQEEKINLKPTKSIVDKYNNTIVNTAVTTHKLNNIYYQKYNGSSSKLTVNSIGTSKNLSFWVKPSVFGDGLIGLGSSQDISLNASKEVVLTNITGIAYVNGVASGTLNDNEWNHISILASTDLDLTSLVIGKTNTNDYYNGLMSDIRFFGDSTETSLISSQLHSGNKNNYK